MIEVGEFTTTPVAALPPKATVSPAAKFVPVTVTGVPPDAGPEAGETALTVGAPAAGGPYVNWSAVLVALVPPGPVTVTSTTPDPDGASAVIEVGEFTTTPVAALPPKATVSPGGEIRPRNRNRGTARRGPRRRIHIAHRGCGGRRSAPRHDHRGRVRLDVHATGVVDFSHVTLRHGRGLRHGGTEGHAEPDARDDHPG